MVVEVYAVRRGRVYRRSLGEAGQFSAATIHYHRLVKTTSYHLGADYPDTLATRGNLAH